MTKIHN